VTAAVQAAAAADQLTDGGVMWLSAADIL